MIKAAIFDWNGVIIDDLKANGQTDCDIIFALTGKKVSLRTWLKGIGQDWRIFFIKQGVKKSDLPKVLPMVAKYYARYSRQAKLSPGTKDLLRYLKAGKIKLGIMSATSRENILANIKRLGLTGLFSFIVAGDDVKNQKPDPEPVKKVIKASGVKPREIVYLDDISDIFILMKKLGVKTIGFKSIISHDLSAADFQVKRMSEVKRLFETGKLA